MKKTLLFISCLLSILSKAQPPKFEWARRMEQKLEAEGHSVAVDVSGNVYTTGSFKGTTDFNPLWDTYNLTSSGSDDIFILKLSASANFIWAKKIGGIDADISYSIAVDVSNNIYLTGSFSGPVDFDPGSGTFDLVSKGLDDIFILKLDPSGNFIWAVGMGGNSSDKSFSLAIDPIENIYTTGTYSEKVDFDPGLASFDLTSVSGSSDIFISKIDNKGNFIWAKSMGGFSYDLGTSIKSDKAGNVYSTGFFSNQSDFDPGLGTFDLMNNGTSTAFISKLDASGNFMWAKKFEGNSFNSAMSLALDKSGNVFTSGSFNGTIDFDPGLATFNLTSLGESDIFITKFDAIGEFQWAKAFGGISNDLGYSISLDNIGNVYATGFFEGIVDFDPNPSETFDLTSSYFAEFFWRDIFILKLELDGNFAWAVNIGSGLEGKGSYIYLDESYNIYTTGYFNNGVGADFDPGPKVFKIQSALNTPTIFIHKMSQLNSLTIYPNPSNGLFNIFIPQLASASKIEIFNNLGVLVFEQTISKNQNCIDFSNYANGLYFIKVMSENKIISTQRIIKQ